MGEKVAAAETEDTKQPMMRLLTDFTQSWLDTHIHGRIICSISLHLLRLSIMLHTKKHLDLKNATSVMKLALVRRYPEELITRFLDQMKRLVRAPLDKPLFANFWYTTIDNLIASLPTTKAKAPRGLSKSDAIDVDADTEGADDVIGIGEATEADSARISHLRSVTEPSIVNQIVARSSHEAGDATQRVTATLLRLVATPTSDLDAEIRKLGVNPDAPGPVPTNSRLQLPPLSSVPGLAYSSFRIHSPLGGSFVESEPFRHLAHYCASIVVFTPHTTDSQAFAGTLGQAVWNPTDLVATRCASYQTVVTDAAAVVSAPAATRTIILSPPLKITTCHRSMIDAQSHLLSQLDLMYTGTIVAASTQQNPAMSDVFYFDTNKKTDLYTPAEASPSVSSGPGDYRATGEIDRLLHRLGVKELPAMLLDRFPWSDSSMLSLLDASDTHDLPGLTVSELTVGRLTADCDRGSFSHPSLFCLCCLTQRMRLDVTSYGKLTPFRLRLGTLYGSTIQTVLTGRLLVVSFSADDHPKVLDMIAEMLDLKSGADHSTRRNLAEMALKAEMCLPPPAMWRRYQLNPTLDILERGDTLVRKAGACHMSFSLDPSEATRLTSIDYLATEELTEGMLLRWKQHFTLCASLRSVEAARQHFAAASDDHIDIDHMMERACGAFPHSMACALLHTAQDALAKEKEHRGTHFSSMTGRRLNVVLDLLPGVIAAVHHARPFYNSLKAAVCTCGCDDGDVIETAAAAAAATTDDDQIDAEYEAAEKQRQKSCADMCDVIDAAQLFEHRRSHFTPEDLTERFLHEHRLIVCMGLWSREGEPAVIRKRPDDTPSVLRPTDLPSLQLCCTLLIMFDPSLFPEPDPSSSSRLSKDDQRRGYSFSSTQTAMEAWMHTLPNLAQVAKVCFIKDLQDHVRAEVKRFDGTIDDTEIARVEEACRLYFFHYLYSVDRERTLNSTTPATITEWLQHEGNMAAARGMLTDVVETYLHARQHGDNAEFGKPDSITADPKAKSCTVSQEIGHLERVFTQHHEYGVFALSGRHSKSIIVSYQKLITATLRYLVWERTGDGHEEAFFARVSSASDHSEGRQRFDLTHALTIAARLLVCRALAPLHDQEHLHLLALAPSTVLASRKSIITATDVDSRTVATTARLFSDIIDLCEAIEPLPPPKKDEAPNGTYREPLVRRACAQVLEADKVHMRGSFDVMMLGTARQSKLRDAIKKLPASSRDATEDDETLHSMAILCTYIKHIEYDTGFTKLHEQLPKMWEIKMFRRPFVAELPADFSDAISKAYTEWASKGRRPVQEICTKLLMQKLAQRVTCIDDPIAWICALQENMPLLENECQTVLQVRATVCLRCARSIARMLPAFTSHPASFVLCPSLS